MVTDPDNIATPIASPSDSPSTPPAPARSRLAGESRDASRVVALEWIDKLAAATALLHAQPDDVEALHQARVSITRLRATLRLLREPLGNGLGSRGEKELRSLNRTLGRVRDLDVRLQWLAKEHDALAPEARAGAALLVAAAEKRRLSRMRRVAPALARHFGTHVEEWRHRLTHYSVPRTVGEPPRVEPLATVIVEQLHRAVTRLEKSLRHAADTRTQEALHEARIAFKRVRALLVPWLDDVPDAKPLFDALSEAQDTLGDMRDAHLLAEDAEREVSKDPGVAEVLSPLAQHFAAISIAARERFEQEWIVNDGSSALQQVPLVARALTALANQETEIERKFLLRSAPPRALETAGVRIAQGWLPGERLRERLRRSVYPDGRVEWTRTVKVGVGVARVELEEPTDPRLFETLWPLTAAARVEKVRHTVADGAFTWEVDVFLDRELVLAEVELPSADTLVTLPDWLAPYVVRDATGESAYVNANLARDRQIPDASR